MLKIADQETVQIQISNQAAPKDINQTITVKSSGKDEETASKVQPLTQSGSLNFFQITTNSHSNFVVAKFKTIITVKKLIITVIQFCAVYSIKWCKNSIIDY
jgi:hypothetical protein